MTDQDDVAYDGTSWELIDYGGSSVIFRASKHREEGELGGTHVYKGELDDVIAALQNVSEADQ